MHNNRNIYNYKLLPNLCYEYYGEELIEDKTTIYRIYVFNVLNLIGLTRTC